MGVYEPISELICTANGSGGPCFGEHGEIGFSTKTAGSPKRRYWLDETTSHLAPFTSSANEKSIYECSTVGLRSFDPIDKQDCVVAAGEPTVDDFQFPSWDQLPEHLQNPTSSADYNSSVPITTAGVSMSAIEGTASMPWDDMDFAMDLDTDMDMGLNQV
jgi:hypothetical protein